MSRAVTRCVVLKQTTIDFRDIKQGDIFAIETVDEAQNMTVSEWSVALQGAQPDKDQPGQFTVPADKVNFVIGKPEVVNNLLRPFSGPEKVLPKSHAVTMGKH